MCFYGFRLIEIGDSEAKTMQDWLNKDLCHDFMILGWMVKDQFQYLRISFHIYWEVVCRISELFAIGVLDSILLNIGKLNELLFELKNPVYIITIKRSVPKISKCLSL